MVVSEFAVEKPKVVTLPPHLVYEVMDGKAIPYRGFQDVLDNTKTLEDIIGSSGLQAFVVSDILRFLFTHLSEDRYEIATNEAGLHLSKKNNLSTDIGIYTVDVLQPEKLTDKYLDIPPLVAIEVDTKADMSQFNHPHDYLYQKTNKLLEFGTERVIWIATASKKVTVATAGQDWITSDWDKTITILPDTVCNLAELLAKRGIK